ncbi:MAG: glycosyltransferase [Caldilineaceae bacterium]|nr:glycosyltransferase [Caldilineaceae bacterium]
MHRAGGWSTFPMAETPIRVLHIVSGIDIGNQAGGAESFALRLIAQLDPMRIAPGLFVMRGDGTDAENAQLARLAAQGVPVFGVQERDTGHDLLSRYWQAIAKFKPDIVNSHSERGDALNWLAGTLHASRPRGVQTVHIDLQWYTRPTFGWIFTNLIAPGFFAAQVAVSSRIQEILNRKVGARLLNRRAHRFFNGVDADLFAGPTASVPSPSLESTLSGQGPMLGIVGRLTEQKGVTYALEALALVLRERPARLLIIGSGPLEEALHAHAAHLGISDSVFFLGWRDDVGTLLPQLDLMVSASLWEGLPTVLLEAMAADVPVVATHVSGSSELVTDGETGWLVPARDPDQLAAAILATLADPQRATAMAAAARARAGQFTIQHTARQYENLYREIARKRRHQLR